MGIIDKLIQPFRSKAVQQYDPEFINVALGLQSAATFVNGNSQNYIKLGYQQNADVWKCITVKGRAAKGIPLVVEQIQQDGNWKRVDFNHPLQRLVDRPNGRQTRSSLVEEFFAYMDLDGNNYVQAIRPQFGEGAGKIRRLNILPAPIIDPVPNPNTGLLDGYRNQQRRDVLVPVEDICHTKGFNPDTLNGGLYKGQAPMRVALRSVEISNEALQTALYQIINHGPRGILTTEDGKNFKNPSKVKKLLDTLKGYRGKYNANKIPALDENLKFINFGLSIVDLALLEVSNLATQNIANALLVPKVLVDDGETTFSNREEANKELIKYGVKPQLDLFADELTWFLCTPEEFGDDLRIRADYSNVAELQLSPLEHSRALDLDFFKTPNEKRQEKGLQALDNPLLDEIHFNRNYMQEEQEDNPGQDGEA